MFVTCWKYGVTVQLIYVSISSATGPSAWFPGQRTEGSTSGKFPDCFTKANSTDQWSDRRKGTKTATEKERKERYVFMMFVYT